MPGKRAEQHRMGKTVLGRLRAFFGRTSFTATEVVQRPPKGNGEMQSNVSLLTCGAIDGPPASGSELAEILSYVRETIDLVSKQLGWLSQQDDSQVSILGPFLGRSLLELSTTALLARLDPMRLLVVRQIQTQPNYDPALRWKASLQWQGDVLAPDKSKDLWTEKLEYEKTSKALLGDPFDHLLWRPAFERMRSSSPMGGNWMAELASIDTDVFIARKREEVSKLYSSLSKGIHHEFVMRPGALYDRATVVDLVQRTSYTVSTLAVVSHYIAHAPFSLSPDVAVHAFNEQEAMEFLK
jgi:hypothetical protein